MNIPNSCREIFLDGITDVYFYPVKNTTLSVPFFVQQILQMNECQFADVALHVTTTDMEGQVVADAVTVKVTPAVGGNGTVYTFEVSATVTMGGDHVREAYKNMQGNDHYIVLRKQDGTYHLCYTLPNTFSLLPSLTNQSYTETYTITATTKAMSDLIPITFKEN